MTHDDLIRMAREAGFEFTSEGRLILRGADWHTEECVQNNLDRFAALVAAHEREACARVCEGLSGRSYEFDMGRLHSAAAIRERGIALRAAIADTQDWSEVEALRESLREHMAEIRRLCAGLAEPEQEPVAWMLICASGEEDDITYEEPSDRLLPGWSYRALYTHPPQRKPLTDVQQEVEQGPFGYFKAEPFGWTDCAETDEGARPLYEHPPRREWVGLIDEDIAMLDWESFATKRECVQTIEAKLKDKNGY